MNMLPTYQHTTIFPTIGPAYGKPRDFNAPPTPHTSLTSTQDAATVPQHFNDNDYPPNFFSIPLIIS